MSKLELNYQQIVHIVTETILMMALTYYFSTQNKKILVYSQTLAHQIEEQDKTIKEMDIRINQLSVHVNQMSQQISGNLNSLSDRIDGIDRKSDSRVKFHPSVKGGVTLPKVPLKASKPKQEEKKDVGTVVEISDNVSDDEEDDTDLDNEIEEELHELEEAEKRESQKDSGLKKKK